MIGGLCNIFLQLIFINWLNAVSIRDHPGRIVTQSDRVMAPDHIGHRGKSDVPAWGDDEVAKVEHMKSKVESFNEFQKRQLGNDEEIKDQTRRGERRGMIQIEDLESKKEDYESYNDSQKEDYEMSEKFSNKDKEISDSENIQETSEKSVDLKSEKPASNIRSREEEMKKDQLHVLTEELEEEIEAEPSQSSYDENEEITETSEVDMDNPQSRVSFEEEKFSSSNRESSRAQSEKSFEYASSKGQEERYYLPQSYRLKNIKSIMSPDLLYALASCGWKDEIAIVDSDFPTDDTICEKSKVIRLDGVPIQPVISEIMNLWELDETMPLGLMLESKDDVSTTLKKMLSEVIAMEENCGRYGTMDKVDILTRPEFIARIKNTRYVIKTGEIGPYNNILLRKGLIQNNCNMQCQSNSASRMKVQEANEDETQSRKSADDGIVAVDTIQENEEIQSNHDQFLESKDRNEMEINHSNTKTEQRVEAINLHEQENQRKEIAADEFEPNNSPGQMSENKDGNDIEINQSNIETDKDQRDETFKLQEQENQTKEIVTNELEPNNSLKVDGDKSTKAKDKSDLEGQLDNILNEDKVKENLEYLYKLNEGNIAEKQENLEEMTEGGSGSHQESLENSTDYSTVVQDKFRKTVGLELNGTFPSKDGEDGVVLMNVEALTKKKTGKSEDENQVTEMSAEEITESKRSGAITGSKKIPYDEDYYFLEHRPLSNDPQPRFSREEIEYGSDLRQEDDISEEENEMKRELKVESRLPGGKPAVVPMSESSEIEGKSLEEPELKSMDRLKNLMSLGAVPPS